LLVAAQQVFTRPLLRNLLPLHDYLEYTHVWSQVFNQGHQRMNVAQTNYFNYMILCTQEQHMQMQGG
jgi:hypothetical protein